MPKKSKDGKTRTHKEALIAYFKDTGEWGFVKKNTYDSFRNSKFWQKEFDEQMKSLELLERGDLRWPRV